MFKRFFLLLCLFASLPAFSLSLADVSIQNDKFVFLEKPLHPGCLELLSGRLDGDDTTLVANIEFERPNGEFVGRGCMSANVYHQQPFIRENFLTYTQNKDNFLKSLKDPLFRFDGFGYKVKKKISDNIYAIDIREFTAGSNDFLATLVVEVVEGFVTHITPKGKITYGKVLSLKKLGTVLNGVVSFEEKIQEMLKMREQLLQESLKKKPVSI